MLTTTLAASPIFATLFFTETLEELLFSFSETATQNVETFGASKLVHVLEKPPESAPAGKNVQKRYYKKNMAKNLQKTYNQMRQMINDN